MGPNVTLLFLGVISVAFASPLLSPDLETLVPTSSGLVRGRVMNNTRVFRGVPYAAPPVGNLRWTPPQKHNGWVTELDATDFGPSCMQPVHRGKDGKIHGGWNTINVSRISEDCLTVNVYAPHNASSLDGRFPVMVYFHAGEFNLGSSNDRENDFPHFADDVILVTSNVRLGVFGFLASEALRSRSPSGGTGNYGMLDQRFTLEWVQENIAEFGGDPSNVLIWGESSGGTSVSYHMTNRPSFPLFHKAVLQSPGLKQVHTWDEGKDNFRFTISALTIRNSPNCSVDAGKYEAFTDTFVQSRKYLKESVMAIEAAQQWCTNQTRCVGFSYDTDRHFAKFVTSIPYIGGIHGRFPGNLTTYVKSGPTEDAAVMSCLLSASADLLNEATVGVPRGDTFNTDAWAPVIDGKDLPRSIEDQISAGVLAPNIDVLLGTNEDEASIFMELVPRIRCEATKADFLVSPYPPPPFDPCRGCCREQPSFFRCDN
ncbi:hypothetical protein CYMTET_31049 [Cymbomonas tetramitiformis]|uniref:Carboxylic ester hydrolase n=1 Tax=Cymbomonas tetramitiformis TaxID=36881 RepID=A0AAE0FHX0_9CHLO|nr:hypothetical protein CYMTET_31049 [Cymbomonas tetramitiformis]